MSSDGDSSDEEERARVRARLASKLGQAPKADAWLELESCLRALDVAKLVEEARGGLVHLKDVVPHPVALQLYDTVQHAEPRAWNSMDSYTASGDHKGFAHSFRAVTSDALRASDAADESEDGRRLLAAFERVCPTQMRPMIGFAGYDRGGFISKHDDGASHVVDGVRWHRNIALVYYLTPGWQRSDGGLFVDHGVSGALDPPVEVVPEFNSLVAFRVWADGPHLHEVTPVLTDRARRYSVFGWFLSREMPT